MQKPTKVYGRRPFGVGLLVAGYDVSWILFLPNQYMLFKFIYACVCVCRCLLLCDVCMYVFMLCMHICMYVCTCSCIRVCVHVGESFFVISGTGHPREDKQDLYYWAKITEQRTHAHTHTHPSLPPSLPPSLHTSLFSFLLDSTPTPWCPTFCVLNHN